MWAKNRFAIASWQSIPEQIAELGLSDQDGRTQVWFVDNRTAGILPAHPLSGGAAAINNALRCIWWARPFALLYQLPLIKQLEDKAYQWTAAHRHQLPGSTQTCKLPSPKSDI